MGLRASDGLALSEEKADVLPESKLELSVESRDPWRRGLRDKEMFFGSENIAVFTRGDEKVLRTIILPPRSDRVLFAEKMFRNRQLTEYFQIMDGWDYVRGKFRSVYFQFLTC